MENLSKNKSILEMKPKFEIVYSGKMFEVVQWEGKPGITFEAAVRAPGVRLLIETTKDNMDGLVMTRELRREAGGWDFRLPGGKVFDSLEELADFRESKQDILPFAIDSAQREAKEEAGVQSGNFTYLEKISAGSSVEWDLHYFKVQDTVLGDQELEEQEIGDIVVVVLSAEEIFKKLSNREIKEGRSADMIWSWLQQKGYISFQKKI